MSKESDLVTKLTAIFQTPYVPSSEDPIIELRRLVQIHSGITRRKVMIESSVADRIARQDIPARNLKKGDKMPTNIPLDVKMMLDAQAAVLDSYADKLIPHMKKSLKKIPIYTEFLENVYGCGPIVAAYLIANIDIHKSLKPSSLRKYCGMAVTNGQLDRPTLGVKLEYNAGLRMRLFQMFSSMWRVGVGNDQTSKYLTIWQDYKHRRLNSSRVINGKIEVRGHMISAAGHAHSYGWHKAADVFVMDLYMIWRALEGLPVWCPYEIDKLGYWHASDMPAWKGGKIMTVREAKELVGFVGNEPIAQAAE